MPVVSVMFPIHSLTCKSSGQAFDCVDDAWCMVILIDGVVSPVVVSLVVWCH